MPRHPPNSKPSQTWRIFLKNHKNILCAYFQYYHNDRTHLSLGKNTPNGRPIQPRPVGKCKIIDLPRIGGLHHRYEWKKAAWKLKSFWYQKHRTVFADLCSESTSIKNFTLNPSFQINWTVDISFNRCTEENIFRQIYHGLIFAKDKWAALALWRWAQLVRGHGRRLIPPVHPPPVWRVFSHRYNRICRLSFWR